MNWELIEELKPIEREKLCRLEKELATHDSCSFSDLKRVLHVDEKQIQNYIKRLKECYDGDNAISRHPYKLQRRDRCFLAFPEMLFSTNDSRQLHSFLKLAAIFDGAIPLKEILDSSGLMNAEISHILKSFSMGMDVQLDVATARLIADIYKAISEKAVVSFCYKKWTKYMY